MRMTRPPRGLTNPYPSDWIEITDFEYLSPLSLLRPIGNVIDRLGEDGDYILQHDFNCAVRIDGRPVMLSVPRGLITDLTSVPPLFRVLVGRVGPWLEAAIIHDFLYIAWSLLPGQGALRRDRLFADRIMLLAMERAGVRRWRRLGIYIGLRLFGAGPYRRADPDRAFVDLGDRALETAFVVPTR